MIAYFAACGGRISFRWRWPGYAFTARANAFRTGVLFLNRSCNRRRSGCLFQASQSSSPAKTPGGGCCSLGPRARSTANSVNSELSLGGWFHRSALAKSSPGPDPPASPVRGPRLVYPHRHSKALAPRLNHFLQRRPVSAVRSLCLQYPSREAWLHLHQWGRIIIYQSAYLRIFPFSATLMNAPCRDCRHRRPLELQVYCVGEGALEGLAANLEIGTEIAAVALSRSLRPTEVTSPPIVCSFLFTSGS